MIWAVQRVLCPVHVGRDDEVAAVMAAIDAVSRTHRGAAYVVAGEAGLGKSRLVGEAVAVAESLSFVRLVGHASPDASVPYAPVVGAIRRYTRRIDDRALAQLLGGSASLAAALLPEARGAAVRVESQPPAPEDLFAAVWQLLYRISTESCGLLVLEDLHWADPDTLRLCGYIVREVADLPMLVLGTYRPDELHRRHPLHLLLAALIKDRVLEEIRLRPLDREQARSLLSATFDGTEVSDEFVDALQAQADGNPFFLEELAKALVVRGDVYRSGGDWSRRELGDIEIPATVKETVLARCRDLGDLAMRVLELAALAGDVLEPDVLARAADVSPHVVDDVVRQALLLQILVERGEGSAGAYRFRHALTREVFGDELVGPERRRAHLAVAEAIVAEHGETANRAGELADHFARAGHAERAAPFALEAARRAADAHAYEEANRRYDEALSGIATLDVDRMELLIEAASRTFDPLDRRAALAFAKEAQALAAERRDPLAEARTLFAIERDRWHAGDTDGQLEVVRHILSLVEGRDDAEEAWALRMLSRLLTLSDRLEEAVLVADRGLEIARRAGHDRALSGLYGTKAMWLSFGSPEWGEAVDAATRHARLSGDADTLANILTNAGYMQLWGGELRAARVALEEAVTLSERVRPTDRYAAAGLAWLLSLIGDYPRALEIAGAVTAADAPPRIVALTAQAEVAQRTGDPLASHVVEELVAVSATTGTRQRTIPALSAAARQALAEDRFEEAAVMFETAATSTLNVAGRGSHWMFSPDYAAALGAAGDAPRLEAWVSTIGDVTASDPHPHNLAALALCEAHLAAAQHRYDRARALFERAAADYGAMPCPARVSEAHLGLAETEWAAGLPDASRQAASRGRSVAAPVGARSLAARAEALVQRAASPSVVATVLFTDIVGSTERAAAAGDAAWCATLERHHAAVRGALARHGGREIDTAGDGFCAAFDSPARAIRCASAVVDTLRRAGLELRAGIHTGECQVADGKLAGLAVHIAARVSAEAAPCEVLVSNTVRELLAGSGMAFDDRGSRELKGVPGSWRLFAPRPPGGATAHLTG
jgi:class 3 adenylate cyclase